MISSKYKLEKITSSASVLLMGSAGQLVNEVYKQLEFHPQLSVKYFEPQEKNLFQSETAVLVYFVGFGRSAPLSAMSATELLHSSLNYCLQANSKLILVIANGNLPICRTAIKIVSQFVGVNRISYEVVEVDPLLPFPDTAELIISKFVYHHRNSNSIPPSQKAVSPQRLSKALPKLNIIKFLKPACTSLLCGFCILYIVFLIQLVLFIFFVRCAESNFLRNSFSLSLSCAEPSGILYRLMGYQSHILPGTGRLLTQIGGPEDKVAEALASFSDTLTILSHLNIKSFAAVDSRELLGFQRSVSNEMLSLKSLYQQSAHTPQLLLSVAEKSETINNELAKLATLIPKKDFLLGFVSPVKYLLVLQDSSPLWPTGGTIDTLISFTLDKGIVVDSQIYDAKVLATQITGSLNPPQDLQRITGISNWSFLQANWDPEFFQTAQKITWFFNKVFRDKIDFVIGLNDSVFPHLLEITGPIKIVGVPGVISSNTYQSLKSVNTKSNTGKYDVSYLGRVLVALKDNYQNLSLSKKNILVYTLLDLLDSRQIMLAPVNLLLPELNIIGWGGSVHLSDCRSQLNCQNIYTYLVDTNLTPGCGNCLVNKKTDISYQINSAEVRVKVLISQNGSGKLDYQRIILPASAHLISVKINNHLISPGIFPAGNYPNLISWGFLVPVAADLNSVLDIEYTQPLLEYNSNPYFLIDLPNQPGAGDSVLNITINYPQNWKASTTSHPAVVTPGTLRYNTSSRDYQKIEINFKKT